MWLREIQAVQGLPSWQDAGLARDLEAAKLAHFLTQFHIMKAVRLVIAVFYEHTAMT
jgi:hypothetical protein